MLLVVFLPQVQGVGLSEGKRKERRPDSGPLSSP